MPAMDLPATDDGSSPARGGPWKQAAAARVGRSGRPPMSKRRPMSKQQRSPHAGGVAGALVEAIRPHQWIKNLACLPGLIFSGQLFVPAMQWRAALAVAGFSAIASTGLSPERLFSIANANRANPRTAARPFASGRLSLLVGFVAAVVLFAVAVAVAAYLSPAASSSWRRTSS